MLIALTVQFGNQEPGCPSGINRCIPKNITGWALNTKLVFVSRLVLWFGLTDLTSCVTITNTVSIGNDCLQDSYHVSGQNWRLQCSNRTFQVSFTCRRCGFNRQSSRFFKFLASITQNLLARST